MAARFWGVAPWELEARADAIHWINEAIVLKSAENKAEHIAVEIAKKRSGTS